MTTVKKHWYFAYATYENHTDQSLNKTSGEFSLPSNNVTKAVFRGVEDDLLKITKAKNPEAEISNFQLISFNYLGEMTKEEFES